ncbi:hypothetical protein CONCODRAFT_168207 [Conidiobolus coronatus NRRL 28638]|uniref:Uncharacterized protein n=1 Tax=Conidiobolus coronatus (strain ATCC 28846 / CBS 209.66 / NRRL 28638) TaxID=796925 RepID=A0A137NVN7_CONC2|nr:hypothetical protein CONCODRAFT_168207 [Conidiobolus coronatus NRRL 28638]|eukprot:KXN66664.1 hypothetical protein CONCODRAFT_168207 [Conidiobolus coronatus NRRL 28638]
MNSFPLLLPINLNNTHYSGYITINGKEYFIDIKTTNRKGNRLSNVEFYCELELENLLKDLKEEIFKKLDWFSDLESLLNYLKNLIEEKNNNNKLSNLDLNWFNNSSIFHSIIQELQQFNANCIKAINSKFTNYELTIQDSFGRDHDIILKLDYDYPQTLPSIELQLPNNQNYIISKSQFNKLSKSDYLITNCLNICVKTNLIHFGK